ncbi:hypothetical protein [Caballeronia zhejiangensis]|uniref:hypothetical protein n=1 Tax=Caballeronia zhejiangensis TaxID=871203 RepID=UPI001F52A0CB|nr:hypothetical protein [Caballeronia zhejiangensis]MCI1047037.1 hypothetical protein [Caballeronia zhejiangensis]
MSTRHANRKPERSLGRKSPGSLTKAMLLPLPESAVREASLARHLTWVPCKKETGSACLVNELVRLVYLTFYVQDAGYGDTDLMVYVQAEAALERCLDWTGPSGKACGALGRKMRHCSRRSCDRGTASLMVCQAMCTWTRARAWIGSR